jgi:hypothetical protein
VKYHTCPDIYIKNIIMNWEYISGFFDADGHITLSGKKEKERTTYIGFTNIDLILLESVRDFILEDINVKGVISKRTSKKENHSTCYNLIYRYDGALKVGEKINSRHYKKREKIQLDLSTYKSVTPRNGKYTEELKEKREKFINEFFSL